MGWRDFLRERRLWIGGGALVAAVVIVTLIVLLGGEDGSPSGGEVASEGTTSSGSVVALPAGTATTDAGTSGPTNSAPKTTGGATGTTKPTKPTGAMTTTPGPAVTSTTSVARAPQPVKGIRGTVVDMDTLKPVAGATVTANGASATSTADGSFTLDVAGLVGDTVLAEKAGYIAAQRLVQGQAGGALGTVRLELLSLTSRNAPPAVPAS